MKQTTTPAFDRRQCLRFSLCGAALASAAAWSPLQALAQVQPVLRRVGVFSLLGDSVRIVARETQEALFKDVGMDTVALDAVGRAIQASQPQTEVRDFRAPAEVDVQDQLKIGLAAARRAELPAWVAQAARESALSHALLVTSSTGAMEFHTGRAQVVGDGLVTGIGFVVSGSGRTTNLNSGAVGTGYIAPFVQLRLTLVDLAGPRLVHSASLSEGYIVGPPTNEAPDPWRYMSRPDKARALDALLRRVVARGMQEVLARV
jgi:hypothetical protein